MESSLAHVRHGRGSVRPYMQGPVELLEFVRRTFEAVELERHEFGPESFHVELSIGDSVLVIEAGELPAGIEPWQCSVYIYVDDVISNFTGDKPSDNSGGTIALEVEDLDRLIANLKAKGVTFKSDVIESIVCRMAVYQDFCCTSSSPAESREPTPIMRDENLRPQTRMMRSCLSFGSSVLVAFLFGTAGCQSGGAATGNAPAPDEAAAAQPLDPTTMKDTRLSGITEGLLTVMNPFVRKAICAVWSKVDATWNARDAERFSRLFADDVSFRFVQRGPSLDGRTAILEHFREQFPRFAPDLHHRTQISAIRAVATGVFTADGKVEILRYGAGGDDAPTISRTFAIFAVMSGKDEDWSIRTLRIYELSAADAGIDNACSDSDEIRFRRPAVAT